MYTLRFAKEITALYDVFAIGNIFSQIQGRWLLQTIRAHNPKNKIILSAVLVLPNRFFNVRILWLCYCLIVISRVDGKCVMQKVHVWNVNTGIKMIPHHPSPNRIQHKLGQFSQ